MLILFINRNKISNYSIAIVMYDNKLLYKLIYFSKYDLKYTKTFKKMLAGHIF